MSLKTIALLLIALSHMMHAMAEAEGDDQRVGKQGLAIPNIFISSDSEGFHANKYKMAYYPWYQHEKKYTGLEYQRSIFKQNTWQSDGDQINFVKKSISSDSKTGYHLSAGYNEQNQHGLLMLDGQIDFKVTDSTSAELAMNRDRVEALNALDQGIYYTLFNLAVEQQLNTRWSMVAVGGALFFSDDNNRPFVKAKLIYELLPEQGITAQLRYRQFHSTRDDSNNYFNPHQYNESMLAFSIKRKIEGWIAQGIVGVGKQYVNDDPSTNAFLLELTITNPPMQQIFFRTRLGYNQSAGFQGPDYAYRYLMEEMVFSF